jgi:hypothetical protein
VLESAARITKALVTGPEKEVGNFRQKVAESVHLLARRFCDDPDNDACDLLVDVISQIFTDALSIRHFLYTHLDSLNAVETVFRAVAIMLIDADSTGTSQKAIKMARHIVAVAARTNKQDGSETSTYLQSCLAVFAESLKTGLLMPGVSDLNNTVALVRFFELTIQISLLSEDVYTAVSKDALIVVLENFFSLDALTQISIMDFIVNIDKMPWAGDVFAPFLGKLFAQFKNEQDVYGLV